MYPVNHINFWYVLLAIVFVAILGYMFLYNRRSRNSERDIEQHDHHLASKEAGILEAQEAMKHKPQHHHP